MTKVTVECVSETDETIYSAVGGMDQNFAIAYAKEQAAKGFRVRIPELNSAWLVMRDGKMEPV